MWKRLTSSQLVRSAGIYGGASLLNGLIPFLLLPILTRNLSEASVGIEANFRTMGGILMQFVGLSTAGSVQRLYFEREEMNFPEYVGNCVLLSFFTTVITVVATLLLSHPIFLITGIPPEWQWTLIAFGFGSFYTSLLLALYQAREMPKAYGAFQISMTLVNFVLSLVLVLIYKMDWQGRVLAQVAAVLVYAIAAYVILVKSKLLKLTFRKDYIRHAYNQGMGLMFHQLGGILMGTGDRLALTKLKGPEAAGVYNVAYQLAMPLQLIQDAFNKSYVPWLYKRLKEDKPGMKERIVRNTYTYDAIYLTLVGVISMIMIPLIPIIATEKYSLAMVHLPWIAFSYALYGMSKLRGCYAVYAQRMGSQSWITIMAGLLNIGLCVYLIPIMGPVGAAVSSALSALFYFLGSWWIASRVFPMPWFARKSPASAKDDSASPPPEH